jgi:hypothetical protein
MSPCGYPVFKPFTQSKTLKLFLSFAFVVFAVSNLAAILRLGELRTAILQLLPLDLASVRPSLAPAAPWQYKLFHGVLDLLVLGAIWFVPWPHTTTDA